MFEGKGERPLVDQPFGGGNKTLGEIDSDHLRYFLAQLKRGAAHGTAKIQGAMGPDFPSAGLGKK